MAVKENSAFRLLRFIEKMIHQGDQLPTASILLAAFGTKKDAKPREQNATLSRITFLLFNELETLVVELHRNGYSDEAIQPIVTPFDRLSAGGMSNNWQHNKPLFGA